MNRARAAGVWGVTATWLGIVAIAVTALIVLATRSARNRLGELDGLAARQAVELSDLKAKRVRLPAERSEAERSLALRQPGNDDPNAMATNGKSAGTREHWRVLAEIQRDKLVSFQLPLVNARSGEILPLVREILDLTPAEATALDATWRSARQKINSLIEEHATARLEADGRLMLHIGNFAGGAGILDELSDGLEKAIGTDRRVAFETLFMEKIAGELAQFGAEERWVTLSRDQTVSDEPQFKVRDERTSFVDASYKQVMATPRSGVLRAVGTRRGDTTLTPAEFAAQYPALARLLPPDF